MAFPCNQFKQQDPGTNEEIVAFARENYGVTFPIYAKIEVNGRGASPLYKYLKEQKSALGGRSIKWNFTKFLVDREGHVIKRYAPTTTPEAIESDIEKIL